MPKMTSNNIYWTVKQWILFPEHSAKVSLHTLQGAIEEPQDFQILLLRTLWILRDNALNGKADAWIETPDLYTLLAQLPGADLICTNKEYIQELISIVKRWHNAYLDGEMWYCIEDWFLKGIRKALLKRHEEHLQERKRRFELWHEDLIAATLHPERVVRMANAFGMQAIDYLEAI